MADRLVMQAWPVLSPMRLQTSMAWHVRRRTPARAATDRNQPGDLICPCIVALLPSVRSPWDYHGSDRLMIGGKLRTNPPRDQWGHAGGPRAGMRWYVMVERTRKGVEPGRCPELSWEVVRWRPTRAGGRNGRNGLGMGLAPRPRAEQAVRRPRAAWIPSSSHPWLWFLCISPSPGIFRCARARTGNSRR